MFTEGYVETCEVNNFEVKTSGQISILCPDIYWYANETQTAEYSQVLGAFHFICPDNDNPFPIGKYNTANMMTIVNDGDDTGITLVISGGPARNPTIYNADTDEYAKSEPYQRIDIYMDET